MATMYTSMSWHMPGNKLHVMTHTIVEGGGGLGEGCEEGVSCREFKYFFIQRFNIDGDGTRHRVTLEHLAVQSPGHQ